MPYTTAWVKETLRLHPPAGTARYVPQVSSTTPPFEVDIPVTVVDADGKTRTTNQSTRINGLRIYICQFLVHRNPAVWGPDAHQFNPGRWLDEEYMSKLPVGAWRPFERGPRNCIGQTLAMVEGIMVLCAVARGLEFEKVGFTGTGEEKGRRRSGSGGLKRWTEEDGREVWSVNQVTSVPVDGMRMRVSLTK